MNYDHFDSIEKFPSTPLTSKVNSSPEQKKEIIEKYFRAIMETLGLDLNDDSLKDTPKRVAKMYVDEIFKGLRLDTFPRIMCVENKFNSQMVTEANITMNSSCIPGDQIIQFVNNGSNKRCANQARVRDKLWTLVDGVPQKTTISDVIRKKAPRISTLTLDNGVKIRVTDDHPIRVKSGWMECGELQIGDKVEWVNGRTLCKTNYAFNIGEDLGYILGAIASDGSIQDDRRICIEVNDLWFVENIKSAYKKAFDVDVNIEKIIKPSGFLGKDIPQYRIRVVSSQIAKRLLKMLKLPQGLGSKSKTKKFKLPEIVKHDISVCRGFLAGYIDGDGTRNFGVTPDGRKWGVNNSYVIASANKEFLLELAEMLQSNFKWTDRREREGNGGMYISPTWENKHGFKQEDFHLDIGESEWIKVKNIETEEKMTTVYSFKCEEYPTFLVNGILTHNCEHHFVTVCGYAHIAYVPHKKVIGLSKMNRIVDYFGNRPQVQERLNEQIQKYLSHVLETNNVAVVIDAVHFCVRARGIKDSSSVTRTASLGGIFKNTPEARAEFFSTIPKIEDFKL